MINSGSTNVKADIDVMAMTMIIMGETIPALTAASPRIKAPTIEMAEDANDGIFRSLSLNISKDIIMMVASTKVENGTFSH